MQKIVGWVSTDKTDSEAIFFQAKSYEKII